MNKYVNSLAVDLAYLQKEEPNLLEQIDNGFFALNDDKIFVDYLAESGKSRGYITFNKQIVKSYRNAYEKLKKYATPIANVIKEN